MSLPLSFDHIGLSVAADNLDATIDWYCTTLDFTLEDRHEVPGLSFAFIVRDGVRLELVGAADGAQPRYGDIGSSHVHERLHHLCFAVADLDAVLADLAERGVTPLGDPVEVAAIGQRFAFITDNLHNIVELTEPGH